MNTEIKVNGKNLMISGRFKDVLKYIIMLNESFPNITIPKLCQKLRFAAAIL